MTNHYTYEDTLHQIIKSLLVQHVEDNEDHWIDVESFQEVRYNISADDLRAADEFMLNVEIHEHVDPVTRRVTLRLIRGRDA